MEILLTKLVALFVYPFGVLTCLVLAATLLLFIGRPRPAKWLALAAVLLLLIGGNGRVAYNLIRSLENDHPPVAAENAPEADVIVVLGGGIRPPLPPRLHIDLADSADRYLEAFRLYRAGKAEHILVSGGNVFPQPGLEGEAFYARQLLETWGVPPGAVTTETASRNTLQNARYTVPILEHNRWDKVLLVTSASHMSRAVLAFRRAGVDVAPMPTDFVAVDDEMPEIITWIPSVNSLGITTRAVHEYVGRFYAWLRT